MPVMHAMLGNAAVAALLALLALAVGSLVRSPAVRHLLWLLVLLKLVTPPLFHIPLAVLPASWEAPPPESPPLVGCVCKPLPSTSAASHFPIPDAEHAPAWWARFRMMRADQWALIVWIAGSTAWFIWQGRRIIRFRRRVARAQDVEPEIALATRRIGKALGVGRPPAVKVANGIGSPMLWGWGRGTVLLFPRELLARLSPEARDTLLAHELAHYLRRDHWVRMVEFVVTGLYWWNPAVWLARVGIETAEEECCDAWVVGGLAASPRRYAEALLATIDYAAELRRPVLPPGACPANRDARLLQRRLIGIIHAKRPSELRGSHAVRTAAIIALLIQPALRAAPSSDPGSEAAVASHDMHLELNARNSKSKCVSPTPTRPAEPPVWATVSSPGGIVTVMARENEVVLRCPDGTVKALAPGKPLTLTFAPNDERLATAGPGSLVRTWDYWGNVLAEVNVPAAARGIAYTPDGGLLLVLDAAGGISVRNPRTLAPVSSWSVEGPANSITCGPDGQTVAVSFGSWLDAETGWVECWSIAERRRLDTYSASAPVGASRFAPDGSMLVMGGWNGLVEWRKLPSGEPISSRQLPKGVVAATAFSPNATTLPLTPPPPEPEVLPGPLPEGAPEIIQDFTSLPTR
ncbi:MAG TPA: M56 family metallopeptidase [Gemmataceae bacterium]|jgi:beta-lactamase regulating signal transducer with metallopeptidase domain